MIIPLSSMTQGCSGKIVRYELDEDTKERLISMGLIIGKEIELVHISPFNDPFVYKIEDNKIMLRKSEASKIYVEISEEIIPLLNAKCGKYKVLSCNGGPFFLNKMKNNGIEPGNEIEVLENKGKITIKSLDKIFIIGKGQAKKIICKKEG
ncbi:hypothetical protein OSSY52_08960 [Tepiditoga spiralis]|uniref:Ferrous iron transporter FeoA-like domain-containing protein n=1 Tax=Tepiditoga spiralis TaxID=2108365 RepID=A0A7G1G3W3_9BACT|nr:ferrous iron transport protein A [Tepiditoga spiralis]BBE30755.1 hypothetical protein OSSY52_08960 [Tepiditoga spiralis]